MRRRYRGQAIVEYAFVALALLPFLVTTVWAMAFTTATIHTATLGAKSAILASYSTVNHAVSHIIFQTDGCVAEYLPGEPFDKCDKTPYAAAASSSKLQVVFKSQFPDFPADIVVSIQ